MEFCFINCWLKIGASGIDNVLLRLYVFDAAIKLGCLRALELLQECLGVNADICDSANKYKDQKELCNKYYLLRNKALTELK